MHPQTTTASLLKLPFHERRTVIVVDDHTAQQFLTQGSASRKKTTGIDEPAWLQPLVYRVAADSGVRRAAVSRARDLAATAARAGGSSSRVTTALAFGAVGAVATAAVFLIGRDEGPDNVTVISASAAEGLSFSEGPFELERLYSAHPKQIGRYLPWASFSRAVLNERTLEAESFLVTCCGASRVETIVEHGDDLSAFASISAIPGIGSGKWDAKLVRSTKDHRVVEAPGWSEPLQIEPSEWVWLNDEPILGEIHRQRATAGATSYERTSEVTDDRSVDLKIPRVLGEKLNLDAVAERHDKTVVTWKVSFPAGGS